MRKVNEILKYTSKISGNNKTIENDTERKYTYNGENLLERLKEIVRRRKENKERGHLVLHFNTNGYIARIEDNVVY